MVLGGSYLIPILTLSYPGMSSLIELGRGVWLSRKGIPVLR